MGENHFAALPVAIYGTIMFLAGVAYTVLTRTLISLHGADSQIGTALGKDYKAKVSVVAYFLAIPLAFVRPWLAFVFYIAIAVMWLAPDRRIERTIGS
jgi:uncharacterized membrane protein